VHCGRRSAANARESRLSFHRNAACSYSYAYRRPTDNALFCRLRLNEPETLGHHRLTVRAGQLAEWAGVVR
jgi:hypothetical protein